MGDLLGPSHIGLGALCLCDARGDCFLRQAHRSALAVRMDRVVVWTAVWSLPDDDLIDRSSCRLSLLFDVTCPADLDIRARHVSAPCCVDKFRVAPVAKQDRAGGCGSHSGSTLALLGNSGRSAGP